MVMDELSELQRRVRGLETEIATLRKTRDDALLKADEKEAAVTGALTSLAERMEELARKVAVKGSS
jgi:cell division protein ZapA